MITYRFMSIHAMKSNKNIYCKCLYFNKTGCYQHIAEFNVNNLQMHGNNYGKFNGTLTVMDLQVCDGIKLDAAFVALHYLSSKD